MTSHTPRVGLAVILMKDNSVLLGKRKGSHASGTWSFPGGHLEYFESFKKCAEREVEEETGLTIKLIDKNPSAVTNDYFKKDDKHYITLFFRALYQKGTPKLMEPEKCSEWQWFDWNKMPYNVMLPIRKLTKYYNPFK